MKIVVLAGGLSPERDVSLASGSLIANALIRSGHKVVLVDVYEGLEVIDASLDSLFYDTHSDKVYMYTVPSIEPNLEEIKNRNDNGSALIGKNVIEVCQYSDVVFIALHGAMGENGQIQATFDALGITYTGTGYIGSLLAMDKDLTKKLLVQARIGTAEWILFDIQHDDIDRICEDIGFPCVAKPCSNGSSIGVSIVYDAHQLKVAIQEIKKYENLVIIEKMIMGREFSVGIIDELVLPVIEIIPKEGFYDYKNKYQAGRAEEICPAELSKELTEKIQKSALAVHHTLRLGDYSRIDFILDDKNEFICLEANTLPGMTPTSLIPQEAAVIGMTYEALCEKIATLPKKI